MAEWQKKAIAKRQSVIDLIPQEWRLPFQLPSAEEQRDVTGGYIRQFLSKRESEITESDASDILKHTTKGDWFAEEVIRAFVHRASLAHQLVSCLHEIFFEAAIEDAKALDGYFAQHKAPKGPLHGLPVSLKDQFHVKGVDTHMGYVGWIGTFEGKRDSPKAKVFESEMVRELRNLGAVLYCKTSVPSTLMTGETFNNIIRYTFNPKNRHLSSGGSSGGEGALLSLRGSPLGFGTDIGGSIRIPASTNGVFGLKPSSGRLPYEGMANSMDGQNTVLSVLGPMSPSIDGIHLAMTSILGQQPWLSDPMVHPLPWRDQIERETRSQLESGRSSFGVIWEEASFVSPHPPIKRALDIVVKTLKGLGHKTFEWDSSSHLNGARILGNAFSYDKSADFRRQFELVGEEFHPYLPVDMSAAEEAKASDIAANNIAKRNFQKAYLDRWLATRDASGTGRPMDAVISPVSPWTSTPPGRWRFKGYCAFPNILDYSACVVPVTTVDKHIDCWAPGFTPLGKDDKDIADMYDPELYDGAPVGLQIVCRRLEEEKVYAIAEYLTKALAGQAQSSARL